MFAMTSCAMSGKSKLQSSGKSYEIIVPKWNENDIAARKQAFVDGNKELKVSRRDIHIDSSYHTIYLIQFKDSNAVKDEVRFSKDFIKKNHNFFAIPAEALNSVEIKQHQNGNKTVQVRSAFIPYPNFTEGHRSAGFEIHLDLVFNSKKQLQTIKNKTRPLPNIEALSNITVTKPETEQFHDLLVGKPLLYSNFAGQEMKAGTIQLENLKEPFKIAFVKTLANGDLKAQLAWAFQVSVGDLHWLCIVDAEGHEIIEIAPEFFS
jgi:hypothetical protein